MVDGRVTLRFLSVQIRPVEEERQLLLFERFFRPEQVFVAAEEQHADRFGVDHPDIVEIAEKIFELDQRRFAGQVGRIRFVECAEQKIQEIFAEPGVRPVSAGDNENPPFAAARGDKRSLTVAAVDDLLRHEIVQRLAHRSDAHAVLGGQLRLGGQPVVPLEPAVGDMTLDFILQPPVDGELLPEFPIHHVQISPSFIL